LAYNYKLLNGIRGCNHYITGGPETDGGDEKTIFSHRTETCENSFIRFGKQLSSLKEYSSKANKRIGLIVVCGAILEALFVIATVVIWVTYTLRLMFWSGRRTPSSIL
jgi:hypothetical protein